MKKLALLTLFAGATMFGQVKKVVASDIHWWGYKVAKTEASSHDGTIKLKSGNVVMKNNQVAGGTFILDMNSLTSTDLRGEYQTKLNNHLKTGDFFETDKYPTAVYKITSVKRSTNKAYPYLIAGNLTVKGKSSAVSFPAKITNTNGTVNIVSDKFSWDRQKFTVAYKSAMQDVVVKDDIDMTINVTAK